mmetsp:Transcript_88216/g.254577  ORF Transcript_88216/g.254577 Transcript_88216/m.254577 type:complete len:212 (-) Transcript_88216:33-668(-)
MNELDAHPLAPSRPALNVCLGIPCAADALATQGPSVQRRCEKVVQDDDAERPDPSRGAVPAHEVANADEPIPWLSLHRLLRSSAELEASAQAARDLALQRFHLGLVPLLPPTRGKHDEGALTSGLQDVHQPLHQYGGEVVPVVANQVIESARRRSHSGHEIAMGLQELRLVFLEGQGDIAIGQQHRATVDIAHPRVQDTVNVDEDERVSHL